MYNIIVRATKLAFYHALTSDGDGLSLNYTLYCKYYKSINLASAYKIIILNYSKPPMLAVKGGARAP